MADLDRRN